MNQPTRLPTVEPRKALWFIGVCSLLAVAVLIWLSVAHPLSATNLDWNYLASSSLNLLASLGAATAGIMVTRQFDKDENPHRVWLSFTIGLWCWVIGQAIVFWLDLTSSPYPTGLSIIDVLWILGYISLGLSLYYQFVLLYNASGKRRTSFYLLLVIVAFVVAALLTNLVIGAGLGQDAHWIVVFVSVLYPAFDLAEGSAAIRLSLLFGRGQWSRPWWGLILFALADGIDTFFWVGGYNLLPETVQNLFNLLSSIFSFGGYLVIGFTLLTNYYILRYGHISGLFRATQQPAPPPSPKS